MALGEFELIAKYFTQHDRGEHVALGIGDDCALVGSKEGHELAITTDTLNEGIHFFKDTDPYLLGYRCLVVNLSDLAAMGARPEFFTLSLTLPEAADSFLAGFSRGLFECAQKAGVALIGGNTTRGPLSVTISAYGFVKKGCALLRSAAQPGDLLYVTGDLGMPGLYVEAGCGRIEVDKEVFSRMERLACTKECRAGFTAELGEGGISRCAIDISDGLVGDLRHILERSGVSCKLYVDKLPLHGVFSEIAMNHKLSCDFACFGGCDYEILFCVSPKKRGELEELARSRGVPVTHIGLILPKGPEEIAALYNGEKLELEKQSFEHFYHH